MKHHMKTIVAAAVALCTVFGVQAQEAGKPALPKVLLIGDSISLGYTKEVTALLKGKAEVSRAPGNNRYSAHGLQHVSKWVGNGGWDVIHFNHGIWDVHMFEEGSDKLVWPLGDKDPATLKRRCTQDEYIANLTGILKVLKPASKTVIFATTTPWTSYGEETKKLIVGNNTAATALMKKEGVRVNDLHALSLPHQGEWLGGDGLHFAPVGYRNLAVAVARAIAEPLGIQIDPAAVEAVLAGKPVP
jgi:hypothetical protein